MSLPERHYEFEFRIDQAIHRRIKIRSYEVITIEIIGFLVINPLQHTISFSIMLNQFYSIFYILLFQGLLSLFILSYQNAPEDVGEINILVFYQQLIIPHQDTLLPGLDIHQ